MDDDVNFFDQKSSPSEPPPPKGEGDYGENVVRLTRKQQPGWKEKWQLAETGQPLPNLFNVMVTLRHHPLLCEMVRYDEMEQATVVVKQIPHTPPDMIIPRQIRDSDVLAIQEEVQLTGLRRVAKATVQDGVQLNAEQSKFHPVREMLDKLAWDGVPRLDTWLSYYLGAEPEAALSEEEANRKRQYISRIGRLFLIAMAARIYRPGCKADYMLILEGPQGILKSTACHVLADKWFSDNLPNLSKGDAVRLSMHLRGKWLIEIAEMSSFNAAETHTLKEFLTQTEERYVPKYGRHDVKEPRQCLFVGTTNESAYLRDPTGARRFWPVRVGVIDIDALKTDRDQILAEAVHLFKSGDPWWPDKEFEAEFIAPEQVARYECDPWQEIIEKWLDAQFTMRVTVNEILKDVLFIQLGHFGTREQRRVSAILGHLKWVLKRTASGRFYERPLEAKNG